MLSTELSTHIPILTSLLFAGIASFLLLIKSIHNFSQTGPQIRTEILKHYYLYSIFAVLRLTFWAFLIIFWLGLTGNLVYLAWQSLMGNSVTWYGSAISSIFAILSVSFLQFCYHLLEIPSSLMMSSHYRMTRFNSLWSLLSITRLRWLRLSIVIPIGTLCILYFRVLFIDRDWSSIAIFSILTAIVTGPFIWNIWPRHVTKQKACKSINDKPNILMIGCDTLRADRLGIANYDSEITPYLDALSRKGTSFLNCYTPLARTAPSLASIFTGTWPNRHGIRSNFVQDNETSFTVPTLPEILKQYGYHSATVSDWSGSDFGKFTFGFDHVEAPEDQWNLRYLLRQGPKDVRLFLSLFTHNRFGKKFLPEIYYLAGVPLTSHLGATTRQRLSHFAKKGEPFLLNTFMATAHPPFGAEYPYYTWNSDPNYKGESKFAMAKLTDPFEIIRQQQEPKEAFDLDQIITLYDNCVRSFDDEVRRIIQHLEACELSDNTIIVIYSDHGMEFFEHNTWGQGNSALGEASAKVPLMIIDPRKKSSNIVDSVVRTIDILPTLLDLCEVPIPKEVQGMSLEPLICQRISSLNLPAYFETGEWLAVPPNTDPRHLTYPNLLELLEVPNLKTGTLSFKKKFEKRIIEARDRMYREGNWKLVRLPLTNGPIYQLYDLSNDPECKFDLATKFPNLTSSLIEKMQFWID